MAPSNFSITCFAFGRPTRAWPSYLYSCQYICEAILKTAKCPVLMSRSIDSITGCVRPSVIRERLISLARPCLIPAGICVVICLRRNVLIGLLLKKALGLKYASWERSMRALPYAPGLARADVSLSALLFFGQRPRRRRWPMVPSHIINTRHLYMRVFQWKKESN